MNRFHTNALTLINFEPTLLFKMIIPVTLSPEAPIQLRFENQVVSHQSATLQKKISSQVRPFCGTFKRNCSIDHFLVTTYEKWLFM